MIFKFGILILATTACSTSAMPPCTCTRDYRPVCGSDGQTYANQCVLNCATVTNAALTMQRPGPCEQAPCVCPFNYKPVCGSDGETYPNECSLNCQRTKNPILEPRHQGPCSEELIIADLPCTCGRDMKPVCGTDGETYSNLCMLECNAQLKTDLGLKHVGPCGEVKVVDQAAPSSCSCTRNLQPVCGTDGVTYSNPCMLECAAQSKPLALKAVGPCDSSETVKVVDQARPSSCSCTRNLQPVCGTDGVTYNNPCLLECAAQNKPLALKTVGPCDPSETVKVVEQPKLPSCSCTRNLQPVCGTDGVTYSNPCLLECAAQNKPLARKTFGPCKDSDADAVKVVEIPQPPKNCACTRNYMPVCGSDGKTYPNTCMLGCASNDNPNLRFFHVGPCDEGLKVDVVEHPVY